MASESARAVDGDAPATAGLRSGLTAVSNQVFQGSEEMAAMMSLTNPNLTYLRVEPDQVVDRLANRWSSQLVQATLLSAINLSLAFGSELAGINDKMNEQNNTWLSTIFLSVGLLAFFAYVMRGSRCNPAPTQHWSYSVALVALPWIGGIYAVASMHI